jgi:hypothetical protein
LFVAVSINLRRILEYPSLPSRAAQTLLLFTTPLLAGLFLLVPGQARAALAAELIALALASGGMQVYLIASSDKTEQETALTWTLSRLRPAAASGGCLIVAGITLATQAGGGLYWLVPATVAAIAFGLINTWVLLIEILR